MRLTKIVATIGPASTSPEMIEKLINAGMDVARLNFSHGTHEEHRATYATIRRVAQKLGRNVGILQDLSGPKIRIGKLKNEVINLKEGDHLTFTTVPTDDGTDGRVFVSYPQLATDVKKNERILLADGLIELQVIDVKGKDVLTVVTDGGELRSKKGVNFSGTKTSIPALSEKDRDDLAFGLELGVDLVALSFVRHPKDVQELKALMKTHGRVVPVFSKIEKPEALEHIDAIIAESQGIMVARGDLAIETPMAKLPAVQKDLIRKARVANVPVIVATQMLESMVGEERPTRAEVSDVANAVYDGTDAVMLSAETAIGKYPDLVIRTMSDIVSEAEKHAYSLTMPCHYDDPAEIDYAVASSAVVMAGVLGARVMIAPTASGRTAQRISRHRVDIPIVALSPHEETLHRLAVVFGVFPVRVPQMSDFTQMMDAALQAARSGGHATTGDFAILTAGHPFNAEGKTNLIKAVTL